ncbi:MAG: hypothetical protein LGR52_04935, partial [Candidatus Thiosymbion ectosymbiont of Robbea hypermnestra]|nr:hypothetical protein [Candidatus Thiosymbion ectosymbiont of Robbea hypermnestra]
INNLSNRRSEIEDAVISRAGYPLVFEFSPQDFDQIKRVGWVEARARVVVFGTVFPAPKPIC